MANSLRSLSEHLASNLIELRRRRGMTQATLSKLAGLPRSTLTYLESGEGNPPLKNLASVAAALHFSPPQQNLWVISGSGRSPSV